MPRITIRKPAKQTLRKIGVVSAYSVIVLSVLGSTALMVERFSRTADGGHDLSI